MAVFFMGFGLGCFVTALVGFLLLVFSDDAGGTPDDDDEHAEAGVG